MRNDMKWGVAALLIVAAGFAGSALRDRDVGAPAKQEPVQPMPEPERAESHASTPARAAPLLVAHVIAPSARPSSEPQPILRLELEDALDAERFPTLPAIADAAAKWQTERDDLEATSSLEELLGRYHARDPKESGIATLACRETLCRIELSPGLMGMTAMMGIGAVLGTAMQTSLEGGANVGPVAYLDRAVIDRAEPPDEMPAMPLPGWQ